MTSSKRIARLAGFLYLITIATGVFSLLLVPSWLEVRGDLAATIANIVAFQSLYRAGIAVGFVSFATWLLLPFVLYALLSPVNQRAAVCMVALGTIFIPIDFVAFADKLDVLSLLTRPDYRRLLTIEQLHTQVRSALDAYYNAILASELFWGLWLFPFGYLVFKSGFLPRILGIALMAGCFSYVIEFLTEILFPSVTLPSFLMWPAALGEFGICLWLLIIGPRYRQNTTTR